MEKEQTKLTACMKKAEHFHIQPLPSMEIFGLLKIHRDNASRRPAPCSGKLPLQRRDFIFKRLNHFLNASQFGFKSL